MRSFQRKWTSGTGWSGSLDATSRIDWVLIFASREALADSKLLEEVRRAHPQAILFGCSTAGEILDTEVSDDSMIATFVTLEGASIRPYYTTLRSSGDSFGAGDRLGREIEKKGLRHALILSPGLQVNGSDLVRGLTRHLPDGVTLTGGLSGDGSAFQETLVLDGAGQPQKNVVSVLAFYGDRLRIGYSSLGGWDAFGDPMVVTRSEGNVLYELDGRSALQLYKQALGEHAKGLPATGLLFPLSLRTDANENAVVRTILAVSEKDESITFAGSMPQGAVTHFMRANFDRVISGASGAAKITKYAGSQSPELAVLISCVGRKLVLKERVGDEVKGVREVLGPKTVLSGFYSYGEVSPFTPGAKCELHNQTMTITTFSESL